MKTKYFSITLAAACLLSLTSCSSSIKPDSRPVLTIMGKTSDMAKSYMTSIFEQYEEYSGVRVDVIDIEDAKYESSALRSFESGNAPDIFMHFNNADLNSFDVENNFLYLNEQSWFDELTQSSLAYCLDGDGNLLGLPFWESSVSGCYYNKTILDSLGLKPATTQAEFDVLCQALKDTGYTPICWPAQGCSWMIQFGLDPIFADDPSMLSKINANEIKYSEIPQVSAMVEWLSDAYKNGWFGTDSLSTGWSEIGKVMSSGGAVMTFIWDTWFYTDFKADKYSVDDFALMPVFMDTADSGTYEGGNLNMMMVNKNGDNIDTALDFLSFCATPQNYNLAFDGIATVSCFNGQTTNIQSDMVTNASASITANERVSTASSRIIGYSADETAEIFNDMFSGKIDSSECVRRMDESRIALAHAQGAEGF